MPEIHWVPGDVSNIHAQAQEVVRYTKIALEQKRAVSGHVIPSAIVDDFGAECVVDMFGDQLLLKLTTTVLAEVIEREIEVVEREGRPVNWWQAWKEEFAPTWYRRRWPVRRDRLKFRVELTRWAHYPHASLPPRPASLGPVVLYDEAFAREVRE